MLVKLRNVLLCALGGAAGTTLGQFLLHHGSLDIWGPLSGATGGTIGGYIGLARRAGRKGVSS